MKKYLLIFIFTLSTTLAFAHTGPNSPTDTPPSKPTNSNGSAPVGALAIPFAAFLATYGLISINKKKED